MTRDNDLRRVTGVCVIVFISTFIYLFLYQNYGLNLWDEGVPLSGALRLARGETPGIDFVAYSPGRYFLYHWSLILMKGNIIGPRTLMSIIGALIGVLIYWIGIHFIRDKFALLPVLVYCLMPSPYYYRFFTLILLFSIAALIEFHKVPTMWRLIFVSFSAASGIWLREELGIFLILCLGICAIKIQHQRKTRKFCVWIPFFFGVISWSLRSFYWGGFTPTFNYYQHVIESLVGFRSDMWLPWPKVWQLAFWKDYGFFIALEDAMIWFPLLIISMALFVTIKQKRLNINWIILIGYCFVGYGLVIARTGFGNVQRSLPPVVITAVSLVYCRKPATDYGRKRFAKVTGAVLLGLIGYDSLIENPQNYYSAGVCGVWKNQVQGSNLDVRTDRQTAFFFETIDREVKRISTPGSSMICLPFHPIWNFSTGFLNPTYYEWLLPGMVPQNQQAEIISAFQNVSPDAFIVGNLAFDYIPERMFSRQYPEVMVWLERNYYRYITLPISPVQQDHIDGRKSLSEYFAIYLSITNAISLLNPADSVLFQNVVGSNRIDSVFLAGERFPVLWQNGPSSIEMPCQIDEMLLLKVKIVSETCFDESFTASVEYKIDQEVVHSLFFGDEVTIENNNGEVLIDLSNYIHSSGLIIFRTEVTSGCKIGWIDPVVFSMPKSLDFVDMDF
ncbi:hypothetical protein JW979_03495 [bacterium]|nr:hypothetical protein [candidate division CSSED10-310 bacterium]